MDKIRVTCKHCGAVFEVYEDELDSDVMAHGAVFDTDYEYTRGVYAECPSCGELVEVSYEVLDWDELTESEQDEMLYWGTVSESDYSRYCDECLGLF